MTIEPEHTLLHYRFVEQIGEGGMGVVWKAVDTKLDRAVAIKLLPDTFSEDTERLARFEREAKTVAALNHPNIVTIHSVEDSDGVHFITMELVDGRKLTDVIPAGGLPLDRFLEIALPLTEAVGVAHRQGVIHRDLKPDNVMLTGDGRVKVLDFGLAKLREHEGAAGGHTQLPTATVTQQGKILGTVAYMSPEQAEGREVDTRSDVFSLGIVLYEMATGRCPFKGDTGLSTLTAILRDTPPSVTEINPRVPRELGRIVKRSMAKEPSERFESAAGLRAELAALKKEIDSGELDAARPTAGTASPGGRRTVIVVVAVAALLLAAFAGWRLLSGRDTPGVPAAAPAIAAVQRTMIVVLPFENVGAAEDDYFATGVTEEITSRLSSVRELGVISRKSAREYAASEKSIRQIGQELGVDYVLEGTVRWAGGQGASRVRITPQLIRVSDDTQLWSDTYDRVIDDIFQIQTEIATGVIDQLGIVLLEPEKRALESRPTDNLDAWQAYQRGLDIAQGSDTDAEDWEVAVEMFERAIRLDPEFVEAWAELAQAGSIIVHLRQGTDLEHLQTAERALARARELAPDAPVVHRAAGFYFYWGLKDYDRALEEFAIAQRGLPSSAELSWGKALVYRRQGRWEEALAEQPRSVKLSPRDANYASDYADTLLSMRRVDEALEMFDRSIALRPDQSWAYLSAALGHMLVGDFAASRRRLEAMPKPDEQLGHLAWSRQLRIEGRYREMIDRLEADPFTVIGLPTFHYPRSLVLAEAHDLAGNREQSARLYGQAVAKLETLVKENDQDPRLHGALGLAYAGSGLGGQAIASGRRAMELLPISRDAIFGTARVYEMALILTRVGDRAAALEQIERLLGVPFSGLSVPILQADPVWKSLRDDPGYAELIARHLDVPGIGE